MRLQRRRREETAFEAPQPRFEVPVHHGPDSAGPVAAGSVQVIWGPMAENLELANMTVSGVLDLLRTPYNIAPDVIALRNGRPAGDSEELEAGDVLEFARRAGEKGGGVH